jgi:hypothetical protein
MNVTRVVNLYKEPFDVYIGRPGKGQSGEFGNPYKGMPKQEAIALFRKYFYKRLKDDPIFNRRVRSLKGKRLGCFCAPKNCHGDVIAEYLNGLSEEDMLKLAVVGSRDFNDYAFMIEILQWYPIKQIISGSARGADSLARRYANEHNISLKEFPAEWNKHGKAAGFMRNKLIVDAADEVIAFWDGSSRGTKHTIDIATENGKPVAIYWPQKQVHNSIPHDEISFL